MNYFLTLSPQAVQSRVIGEENCYQMEFDEYFNSSCNNEDMSDEEFNSFINDEEIDHLLNSFLEPYDNNLNSPTVAGWLTKWRCLQKCRKRTKRLPVPPHIKKAYMTACLISCQLGWQLPGLNLK